MRKKIVAFVFAAGLLMALAVPVFGNVGTASADKPDVPGCIGAAVSAQAQEGLRNDVVAALKAANPDTNLGQLIQAWKGPACGIPPKHTDD